MLYLGWIVAAFLSGFLAALWYLQRTKRSTLRKKFSCVEAFEGRSYAEVLTLAGAAPNTVISLADGTSLRIWREESYLIALKFNAQDICLGVFDEQT